MSQSRSSFDQCALGEPLPASINGAPPIISTARESNDALAQQLAVICHELRNSLAVIRGAARLLRSSAEGREINNSRFLIERHVGQMSRHIEDLLQSRPNGRGHGLRFGNVDLRVIARYAVDAIGPEMERREHRLVVQLPEEPIWVRADGVRLEQVFSNLLINAAKYTPDGGDIALTMERVGGHACIRFCDSGIGISPAMLARVFQLFAQADPLDARAEGGRGIGLAVVRDLVEAHGGSVQATSAGLGLGSQFTVLLPALWSEAALRAPESGAR